MKEIPVHLIDGEPPSLGVLADYLALKGIKTIRHASIDAFLASSQHARKGCVILDACTMDSGVEELQEQLIESNVSMPAIFLVNAIGVPAVVRVMRRGAHFLMVKPIDMEIINAQVQDALQIQAGRRIQELQQGEMRRRISRLTDRERTILSLALAGKQNKEIALILSISHRTVEAHRSHILAKTAVSNLLELMGAVIEIEHVAQDSGALFRPADKTV